MDKFTTIQIKGERASILKIGRRGKGRVIIDNDAFEVPRTFTADDLDKYLSNARRCEPDWYEDDDSSGHLMAVKFEQDKVYFTKWAGSTADSFSWKEMEPGVKKAMEAAGG